MIIIYLKEIGHNMKQLYDDGCELVKTLCRCPWTSPQWLCTFHSHLNELVSTKNNSCLLPRTIISWNIELVRSWLLLFPCIIIFASTFCAYIIELYSFSHFITPVLRIILWKFVFPIVEACFPITMITFESWTDLPATSNWSPIKVYSTYVLLAKYTGYHLLVF